MAMYLLVLLLVIVFGLAWGALFAFLLREIHLRHPLPLGGTIGLRKPSKTKSSITENVDTETPEVVETANESTAGDSFGNAEIDNPLSTNDSNTDSPSEGQDAPVDVSVFDGTENISDNLPPVTDTLEAMIAETTPTIPSEFESIIERRAKTKDEVLSEISSITDNLDQDDLRALEDALPGTKIDFSQELETEEETADAVPSIVKEVLGEDFDLNALEEQAAQIRQSLQPTVLDIQESETGIVQVSSPFMAYVPQLADISVPQTILPTFSSDWIQESGSASEHLEGDPSLFCFTEESRQMFVRKKKNVGR